MQNSTKYAHHVVRALGVLMGLGCLLAAMLLPSQAFAQPATPAQQVGISNMVMGHCLPAMDGGVCRAFNEADRSKPASNPNGLHFLGDGAVVTRQQYYNFASDADMCKRLESACRGNWTSVDCIIGRYKFKQTPRSLARGRVAVPVSAAPVSAGR